MDLLIVEPVEPEVVQWLEARFEVHCAPHLAQEPLALRKALYQASAIFTPPSVAIDRVVLKAAPRLRVIGRLSSGVENIDLEACERAGIEVIRPDGAGAAAEAEFCIGALLQLFRRVAVRSAEGLLVGRELGAARVGLVGLTPASRPLARLLGSFGAEVVGYDPAMHASDALWADTGVTPVSLRDLFERCDAVCVLLPFFTRYRGLISERYLLACKPDQVLVSLTHASLFEEASLAEALGSGRMAAAWLDSVEPGMLATGRPLAVVHNLQVTPRVASTTRESRRRSAWTVARRIDEILNGGRVDEALKTRWSGGAADPAIG
jgi:phosphoglycerate dehydrogenase-like enzyme